MSHREGENLEQCSIAVLLRLAADGEELSASQHARLEAHLADHPEDASRLAFEQKLREACKRACCPGGCAPPSLRDRVVANCCQEPRGVAGSVEMTRSRSFWLGRAVSRFGALAALIGLIAVVSFMVGRSGGVGSGGTAERLAAQLAGFVRNEHVRCTDSGPSITTKFTIHEVGRVPDEFSAIVGRPMTIPCLLNADAAGLRFVDAGLCHPPGGDALHLRFRVKREGGLGELVSLWVQADDGRLPMEDGVTYTQGEGDRCVRFWRVEGVRYVLVCPSVEAAPVAVAALDSPARIQPF